MKFGFFSARRRQLAALSLVAFGLWILSLLFPQTWSAGIILQGCVFGAGAGLLAMGLVLTYRAARVINFAYGAMGSAAAEFGVVAYERFRLPWGVSVLISLFVGALIGGLVHLILRRFENAARLVVTVATIGILEILVGLQFGVAIWSHADPLVAPFTTGLSAFHVQVTRTVFTANDLVALALAPIGLGLLGWLLLRSEPGIAVRGMADNPERAQLLGIPIRRLSLLVWVVVGLLAAAVMILNAPTNGLPSDPFVSVGGVFMPALAAAVIAKLENLPTAFVSGVALGIFDALISYNVHKEALTSVALLVVVVVVLVIRRFPTGRGDRDESSWSLSTTSRPLPAAAAQLASVRFGRIGVLVVIAVAAVVFPLLAVPSQIHTVTGYVVLGMAVLSLVVLSGWAGNISLGQMAVVGVGAVTAGDLIVKSNLDTFLALGAAAIVAAVVSVLIGLPALRVRPIFLAVTTLAFAAAMDQYVLNPSNYPRWIPTTILRPVLWKRFPLGSEKAMYFVCVAILVATILVVRALKRSRPGRILQGSRDNPNAAAAHGIAIVRTRVGGMILAGMIAGIAGGLWAILQEGVGASSFPAQDSVTLFSMAVVGGLGSISGSLSGVAVTELLIFLIGQVSGHDAPFATLGTGAILLGVLLVFPGGLGQAIESVRDSVVGWLAARRGIELVVGAADRTVASSTPPDLSPWSDIPSATGAQALLSCRDLTVSYGPLQVLFGVDLDIFENEIVVLLGTNGAGKSTILKAVTGLIPYGGRIEFDGMAHDGVDVDGNLRSGLALMPGERSIFPSLSVADNLRLSCWRLRKDKSSVLRAEQEMHVAFPSLFGFSKQLAGVLSGGEQQQLSLAMAFAAKPRLLLIDELSLGLAPAVIAQLCETVRDIGAAGTTVVIIEQSLNVARQLADRVVFLERGVVRFQGETADLLDRPDLLRSVLIGGSRDAVPREGGEPRQLSYDPQHNSRLVCKGITKHFGGVTALSGIDLTVESGTIVGLIGHNGAGKTTLFDVISGYLEPSQGSIVFDGVDVSDVPPHKRAVAGLGRSFQDARLFPSLTVTETIMASLDSHLSSHDWFAAALTAPPSVDSERSGYVRCAEIIDLLGLGDLALVPIADLSSGTRRIVELACLLALDPSVLLLDEPSAGLAQMETEALGPLLRKIQETSRCAMVIIDHDMGLLAHLCDELIALEHGFIICTGTPDYVLAHPDVVHSYLGIGEGGRASAPALEY